MGTTNNLAWNNNPHPPTFPLNFSKDASTFNIAAVPCFVEGTRILTARGEVAVEDLVEGDEAVLAGGGARTVIWIGDRRVRAASHPRPAEVNPVRVCAGAFGEGAPRRDLRLSPGHAVWMDGVLIPVGRLVNGATIVQEQVETVRYFHVELDAHDVLLAEGLACESYLDDGNREIFANSPEHVALFGPLDPLDREHACAPVVENGPALEAARAVLLGLAGRLGWTLGHEPDLALSIDGRSVSPAHAAEGRIWLVAPAGAGELVLTSQAGRPAEVSPAGADPRRLGVAVAKVRVDGRPLDLADPAFGRGFHELERLGEAAWRWTDGEARIDLTAAVGSAGPAMVEIAISMTAEHWVRRPVPSALRLVAAG